MEIRPLTSYPGHEGWPNFSPDGNQVAFAWRREGREDFDLYVKTIGSDNPLQLTNTPDWDIGPAWSTDGGQIAFNRSRRDGKSGIYVVSPLGGPERLVTELRAKGPAFWWPTEKQSCPKVSWSPDGKWLAVQDHELYLLSLATGEKRVLTSPSPEWAYESSPAFSPDGRSLAFARWKSVGFLADVYTIPRTGGKPKRLTADEREILGLCWSADGREIVFSSTRSGEPSLWRIPVSGGAPRRVLEAGQHAWFPSISRQGRRLAFTQQITDLNIWRVEAPGNAGIAGQSYRLIASTKTETAPEFSPDGKRIGFASDRSGTMQIWVCDQDGSNPLQLTSLPGPGAELPAWSPDGRSIAFQSAARGNWDIYVLPAEGGVPRRLTAEGSNDSGPGWSRDGRWVYFGSNRTGRFEVWKVPAEGGTAVQVTRNGGYRPVESRDGRFVYYTKGQTLRDAWKIPAGAGQETPFLENLRSRWSLADGGIYLFEQEPDGRWFLKFVDFATRRKRPVTVVAGTPVSGPTVSPDGRTFLYVAWDLGEADLVLVENFR
jgi:Tol biopolymer transport system component